MKRRALTIALAILLAVLGTAGILAYVRRADSRAVAGMKAVTALVAQQQIPSGTPAGTALREGLLASRTLPASSVPADVVSSLGGLGGLVTSADVQPGQLLLRPMLVSAAQATSGLAIPAGKVAVTVQLCLPEAVAGNLHPGSLVAVFDTAAPGSGTTVSAQGNCTGPHQQQSAATARTRVVLPSVQVLSIGQAAAGQAGPAATTGTSGTSSSAGSSGQSTMLVTMAVTQAEAARLILITETGLPYLALLK